MSGAPGVAATTAPGGAVLSALEEDAATYLMRTYARQPVALVRGQGTRVWDATGRELVDLVAGIAVNVLGHAHPAVQRAVAEQAARLVHTSNLYYTEPQVRLAERLVASAFPSRVFMCNSGAEANEAAIKIARKWGRLHRDGAFRIVCMRGAFHGRTLATLAATGNARYSDAFQPLPDGFDHVAFDDAGAVAEAVTDATAAVLVEPIQGESGVVPMRLETLRALRRLCDERDLLLIVDEVQTGMGRTGRMWAHQHAGIAPDVMTAAKGLGGGVPIGAVLASPRADVLEPGDHGSTFGGNPLACSAALAVLATIDSEGLVARADAAGTRLRTRLEELPGVAEVRGRGLMLGAVLDGDHAQRAARAALDAGVIVNAIGDRVLRMVPPLVLSDPDIDTAIPRLAEALEVAATEGGA